MALPFQDPLRSPVQSSAEPDHSQYNRGRMSEEKSLQRTGSFDRDNIIQHTITTLNHSPLNTPLSQHSPLPLPLSSSKFRLPLFPPSPRLSKMKPRHPSLDSPVRHTTSNHCHKHNGRRNSNNPKVNVRVLDTREIFKVHAKVAAKESQGCEEDGHQGDDGHCRVCAGT